MNSRARIVNNLNSLIIGEAIFASLIWLFSIIIIRPVDRRIPLKLQ